MLTGISPGTIPSGDNAHHGRGQEWFQKVQSLHHPKHTCLPVYEGQRYEQFTQSAASAMDPSHPVST